MGVVKIRRMKGSMKSFSREYFRIDDENINSYEKLNNKILKVKVIFISCEAVSRQRSALSEGIKNACYAPADLNKTMNGFVRHIG